MLAEYPGIGLLFEQIWLWSGVLCGFIGCVMIVNFAHDGKNPFDAIFAGLLIFVGIWVIWPFLLFGAVIAVTLMAPFYPLYLLGKWLSKR
jgi:hypothetical protein